jgi:4-amino-4-deoxy-L-arabinose transferase-like glycosyltransferase
MSVEEAERSATRPVAAIAIGSTLLLLVVAGRYGYHRDELYFVEAGKHLDWGYVDQPPFTPLIARLAESWFPNNLFALRFVPAIATGCVVVAGAALARELGANRKGQIFAAIAVAGAGFPLGVGHLLATATFDFLWWMVLLWLFARLLRTNDVRLWVAMGAVAGVAMLNKDLVPLLAVSLAIGLAIERRWDLLRTRWLPAGAAVALTIAAPNLIWQAANSWPQMEMSRALARRLGVVNRVTLLPGQVLLAGPLLLFFTVIGVRWLLQSDEGRRFRPLLWAWIAGIVISLITAGRPYYPIPLTIAIVVVGVVARTRTGGSMRLATTLLVVNAVFTVPTALPLLPLSTLSSTGFADVNEAVAETVGFPELAQQVKVVVDGLPAQERAGVILLTFTYGEAGALDHFGPALGLPPAYSPHNSYSYFRQPTDDTATVVAVRFDREAIEPYFDSCDQVATVDNSYHIKNEAYGTPIWVCRGLRGSWSDIWPRIRKYS